MDPIDQQKLPTENKWVILFGFIFVLGMCLLQMDTMWVRLQRHWSSLLTYEQREAITVLILYPVPCLHFFRKFQENANLRFLLVLLTYALLSLATSLIFR